MKIVRAANMVSLLAMLVFQCLLAVESHKLKASVVPLEQSLKTTMDQRDQFLKQIEQDSDEIKKMADLIKKLNDKLPVKSQEWLQSPERIVPLVHNTLKEKT